VIRLADVQALGLPTGDEPRVNVRASGAVS
jgi:hypothetical protein